MSTSPFSSWPFNTAGPSSPYAAASTQAVLNMAAKPATQNYPLFLPQANAYSAITPFPFPSINSYKAPTTPSYLPAYTAPSYATAQATAGAGYNYINNNYSASIYPAPVNPFPLPSYPSVPSYPQAQASATASASSDDSQQLLTLLLVLLTSLGNQKNNTPAPAPAPTPSYDNHSTSHNHDNDNHHTDTSHKDKPNADILEKDAPKPTKDWGAVKEGAKPTLGKDGNYHIPPKHKSGREGIISPDGQIIQRARDPLAFDLDGNGFNTTDEKVKANIDGRKMKVNNIAQGDAVMTVNGTIIGDKSDLSAMGITEKPKDAQDALRLIAEQAVKDGVIADATNLSADDLETLHENYGVSVRVGSLNAQDGSFADAGINGLNISKAANKIQTNFDGKGNFLTQNGTTFTRKDGTKGDVADIWFKK